MAPSASHHHRSVLTQSNKKFGRRHASKGATKALSKGRTESVVPSLRGPLAGAAASPLGARIGRRNRAVQLRKAHDEALLKARDVYGKQNMPRAVVCASLAPDVDAWEVLLRMEADDDVVVTRKAGRCCEIELTRHRTVLQVHCPAYGALFPLLDLAQSSDFLLFFLSASHSIDPGSWGETALRILQAQGMPSVQCAVPTLLPDDAPAKAGARQRASQGARSSLLSFAQYFAPTLEKVHALDDRAERGALFRTLATSTPRRVAWRDARAWGIVEEAAFDAPAGAESGTLSVETWVRGAPLSAQRLVHLPDFGDFIVRRIVAAPLSKRHEKRAKKGDAEMADAEPQQLVLDEREEGYADDLVETNEPDAMAAEQTWPTEEEMADAPAAAAMTADEAVPDAAPGTTPASISKIAAKAKRGEASRRKYEAAWIVESDDEELDEEDGEMMETDSAAAAEEQAALLSEDENFDDEDEDFDDEEDAEALAAYQAQRAEDKAKRARDDEDAKFPDEVDTPLAIPARQRFARYRGLRSLRTSEWDAYEDLPLDYARIFQFDDYRRTRRRVEGEALEEGIAVGQRVKLVLENVPRAAAARAGAFGMPERDSRPVLFGLLRHEHKMSVLNFTVARNTEYEGSVKSKDPLVLCLGPRRLRVNPIWSEHNPANNGSRGTNNVHRFSRFLRGGSGAVSVGTVLAPVTFGGANVPAVLLRERRLDGEMGHDQRGVGANQMPHLVGSGSLLDAAPTRINVKRIVLTGHPFKVHKKTATIRWMFFNSSDVHYFKPIELHTKYGKAGHIKESLGTHGYFKAHFSQPINQMDTIMLPLFKRVFPKWSSLYQDAHQELPIVPDEAEQGDGDAMQMHTREAFAEV